MNSQALWFATRSTGVIALVLLTASLVLGILTSTRFARPTMPRFVTMGLHRNVSLLVLVFLGLHIATSVADTYAPVSWLDAVVPFAGAYRPLWLGLGAVSFDLLLAVTVTSLLRNKVGYPTWRWVHWASYACWPTAVVHGVGTGTDTKLPLNLAVTGGCVLAVMIALWYRLATGWPDHLGVRASSVVLSVALPAVAVGWMINGPLASGWARRSGTPVSLLAHPGPASSSAAVASSTPPNSAGTAPSAQRLPPAPFTAALSGSVSQSAPNANGEIAIRLHAITSGGASGVLDIVLNGMPSSAGGVNLTGSHVSYGSAAEPSQFTGQLTDLRGDLLTISMRDRSGRVLALAVTVSINGAQLTGQLSAGAGGGR